MDRFLIEYFDGSYAEMNADCWSDILDIIGPVKLGLDVKAIIRLPDAG